MADMDSNCKDEEGKGLLEGKQISRRDFIKTVGVAGATIGLAGGLGGFIAACGKEGGTATTAAGAGTTVAVGAEAGREIKIGFVSPRTGQLANFGAADAYCMDRAVEAIGDGIVCGDGKKHPVKIVIQDSQSDSARAAAVTGDLINNTKVDMIVTASTPDTVNPVATQCEALRDPVPVERLPVAAVHRPRQHRGLLGHLQVVLSHLLGSGRCDNQLLRHVGPADHQQEGRRHLVKRSRRPSVEGWLGQCLRATRSHAYRPECVHGRRHGLLDPDQPVQGRQVRYRRGHVHTAGLRHLLDPGQPAGLEAEDRQFRQGSPVPRSPGRPGRHRERAHHRGVVDAYAPVHLVAQRRDLPAVRRQVRPRRPVASGLSRCCTSSSSRWPWMFSSAPPTSKTRTPS